MGGKEDLIFRNCKRCQNKNVLAWTKQVPMAVGLGLVTLHLDFVNPDVTMRGCPKRVTR